MNSAGGRIAFVLAATAVSALFHAAFLSDLSTRWEYYGFVYRNHEAAAAVAAYLLAIGPSLLLPYDGGRPSLIIAWTLYLVVYVPSMFCVALVSPTLAYAMPLLVSLASGMTIITTAYYVPVSIPLRRRRALPLKAFLVVTGALAVAMLASVLFLYRDRLSLASLETMYDIRLSAREIQDSSPIVKYFNHWLSRAVFPFLLCAALIRRAYVGVAAVIAGYLLLFMTTAHKLYFIVPATVVAVFYLATRFQRRLGHAIAFSVVAVMVLAHLVESTPVRDLVFMRSLGWSGLATYIYDDFVRSHPVTWWSHIKGFSLILENPYTETIPFVIGYAYWGRSELTSNAHFWAMDGIMAAGNAGIIVISIACAALLRVIDILSRDVLPQIALPWMAAYAAALSDAGLFSALLTGGLGFVLLAFAGLPRALRRPPHTLTRPTPMRRLGRRSNTDPAV